MPEAHSCGTTSASRYTRIPCNSCGVTQLERYMQSAAGRLLAHVADLDAMLQTPGFACTADDIDAESWRALRVLWSERDKYVKEERRRVEQEAKIKDLNNNRGKQIQSRH